jgi:hypothetical protein
MSNGSRTLLRESWDVRVYRRPQRGNYFLFDLDSETEAPRNAKVQISKAALGGIAVRGRGAWAKGKGGLDELSSEGKGRAEHARWAFMGGQEKGKTAGIAVLSHPSNVGAPQALSHENNPQPFLNFTPVAEGALDVNAPLPLHQRYRFVALDGKPDTQLLERLWRDFAEPPAVTVHPVVAPAKK